MSDEHTLLCPVCGFDKLNEPAYGGNGCSSFGICPCCGTEFGYDDNTRKHAILRNEWKSRGMEWWSNNTKSPVNWDASSKLKNAGFGNCTIF